MDGPSEWEERCMGRQPGYGFRERREERHRMYRRRDVDEEEPRKSIPTNVPPSKAIGLFGLNIHATEDDVRDFLKEKISDIRDYRVILVYDRHRGGSKGYGFVYFDTLDDAVTAKTRLEGEMIKGKEVRVDYTTNSIRQHERPQEH